MNFKDYYSAQAKEYSRYRPTYPDELFQYLNSLVSSYDLAVDCATGNGQAAIGLANYFKKVIAIDASKSQIENSYKHSNVEYKIGKAEDTRLKAKSADIMTIATAIHWIDKKLFYDEVKRVLKDDGVFAIWTYGTTNNINTEIDELINSFSKNVLDVHWDRDIDQITSFENIEFPFIELTAPEFEIKKTLSCDEFLNYLYTWSSVHKYIEVNNSNPIYLLKEDLKKVWGAEKREIIWNVKMKAGTNLKSKI